MKEITFNDFYQLYQKESLSVLDVREVEEFETLHLEGARNLPLSQLADTYKQLDKDNLYYVICKSGMRSARACQFLAEQGYEVINVQGGMDALEYEKTPFKTENKNGFKGSLFALKIRKLKTF